MLIGAEWRHHEKSHNSNSSSTGTYGGRVDLIFLLRGGDEESQTDVIVTVNGGTELNLTGDVGEVIRKVNESNGYVYNYHTDSLVFDYDKKTNNIYVPRDASPGKITYIENENGELIPFYN